MVKILTLGYGLIVLMGTCMAGKREGAHVPLWLHEIKTAGNQQNLKAVAPDEARTHGLQIMRLTRCLLRYGGFSDISGR